MAAGVGAAGGRLLPTRRINDTTRCRAMTMTKSTELTMMKVTTTMALNDRQTERETAARHGQQATGWGTFQVTGRGVRVAGCCYSSGSWRGNLRLA